MGKIKAFFNMFMGNFVWKDINKKIDFKKNDFLFVLMDEKFIPYIVKYFDVFKRFHHTDKIYMISDKDININDEEMLQMIGGKKNVLFYSHEQLKCFSNFYTIFVNDKRVQFLSLEYPYGRNGTALIGLKDIDFEDVVYIGILNLGNVDREEYDGK